MKSYYNIDAKDFSVMKTNNGYVICQNVGGIPIGIYSHKLKDYIYSILQDIYNGKYSTIGELVCSLYIRCRGHAYLD